MLKADFEGILARKPSRVLVLPRAEKPIAPGFKKNFLQVGLRTSYPDTNERRQTKLEAFSMSPKYKYNTLRQLTETYPLSGPTIYRMIKKGLFPQPVKIGRRSYWIADEVEAAMQALADARG
ncbi:helix-turn-helix transcriptional regulator [Ruegeria arenilitoris]|uniref:helix-turn-helix transcriptional regulator n=1 Tax=Ruegeria arenilitoris TaxID=1173585 RepID=UPI0020C2826D|nr:AlpA family phage regulatory protein [Ruegeria arenilitoris]